MERRYVYIKIPWFPFGIKFIERKFPLIATEAVLHAIGKRRTMTKKDEGSKTAIFLAFFFFFSPLYLPSECLRQVPSSSLSSYHLSFIHITPIFFMEGDRDSFLAIEEEKKYPFICNLLIVLCEWMNECALSSLSASAWKRMGYWKTQTKVAITIFVLLCIAAAVAVPVTFVLRDDRGIYFYFFLFFSSSWWWKSNGII